MTSLHYFNFPGSRPKFSIPVGMAVIESGLADFDNSSNEALAFPFESAQRLKEAGPSRLLIDLPYEAMVLGTGKGYLIELEDFIKSVLGFQYSKLLRIDYPFWGIPVDAYRLLLVAGSSPVKVPKPNALGVTVQGLIPSLGYFTKRPEKRSLLVPGAHSMDGYANAAEELLPDPTLWGQKYPLCEFVNGSDSLVIGRLGRSEIITLWGYHPKTLLSAELVPIMPLKVYENVAGALQAE